MTKVTNERRAVIRVPHEVLRALKAHAARMGLQISQVAEMAIVAFLGKKQNSERRAKR